MIKINEIRPGLQVRYNGHTQTVAQINRLYFEGQLHDASVVYFRESIYPKPLRHVSQKAMPVDITQ